MDPAKLRRDDFHLCETEAEIRITLVFDDLSSNAQTDFAAYYRQGQLRCTALATWDENTQTAPVTQRGERLGMAEFRRYFESDSDGRSASDLKGIYQSLRGTFSDLPSVSTKAKMAEALHEFEADHPESCSPIESGDSFYGWTKGANLLEKYLAWVYVPAVLDAGDEQEGHKGNALARLLERAVGAQPRLAGGLDEIRSEAHSKLENLLATHTERLTGLSEALTSRLRRTYPGSGLNNHRLKGGGFIYD